MTAPTGPWASTAATGPRPGAPLTPYTGLPQIPPGRYERVLFPAVTLPVFYQSGADDLALVDCEFGSGTVLGGDRLTMTHTRVAGGLSLSGVDNAVLDHVDLHTSASDLLHITSDTGPCRRITIVDSTLRNPVPRADAHADGIQVRGIDGLTLRRCTVDLGPWAQVNGTDVLHAALFLENTQGGNRDIVVRDCLLNGGGTTIVAGAVTGGFVLTGNRWGSDDHYAPVNLATTPTLALDNTRLTGGAVIADTPGARDLTLHWGPMGVAWTLIAAEVPVRLHQSAGERFFLAVTITNTRPGPLPALDVWFATTPAAAHTPTTTDWRPGVWEAPAALILVGSGALELPAGPRAIWCKASNGIETLVHRIGFLDVH
ncbi:hypothetical protein [Alloactinosynnema sp. L-07]|uniref:hypothetical protein n=1 Tax=Alloactinosynnema sp. L-07 TaxID=1653480 RepID=UPI00065EF3CF|nr:hypothetical protein [Alloactinosynnema sp. L-07]CRK55439.1 hypothetical protein [Alloactinosynnema sp. L-07]